MNEAIEKRNIDKYIMLKTQKSEEEYERCVENYIAYYDKRGKFYKKIYFTGTSLKLIAVACIPVAEFFSNEKGEANWMVLALSAFIICAEAILGKLKAHEKYLSYRKTCDRLCSEQRMYSTGSCGYKGKKHPFQRYVRRIEKIIMEESSEWKKYMKKKDDKKGQ